MLPDQPSPSTPVTPAVDHFLTGKRALKLNLASFTSIMNEICIRRFRTVEFFKSRSAMTWTHDGNSDDMDLDVTLMSFPETGPDGKLLHRAVVVMS